MTAGLTESLQGLLSMDFDVQALLGSSMWNSQLPSSNIKELYGDWFLIGYYTLTVKRNVCPNLAGRYVDLCALSATGRYTNTKHI